MEENTNVETVETTETETGDSQKLTFTQEELNMLLQKEGDKRVSSALKKAERKQAEAVREAEKLAKLSEEEKYAYELEQREKAIAEKERQLALMENKSTAVSILADKGISVKLVDFVLAPDAETMMENINTLEQEFKASVKAEVEKRLQTSTPKKSLPMDKNITLEDFRKMSLTEQARLFNEQPELYNSFTQR